MMFRGGTSRGLYFRAEDLPRDREAIGRILLSAMGSYSETQIDGVGGATPLTSKVAIVSPSKEAGVDVDYLFAQVGFLEPIVDFGPTCGNILSGIGPYAIEQGIVEAKEGETTVRIRLVNTGALVDAVIQTPGGRVNYEGDTAIDGVPGTAAPVVLNFVEATGSKTGALFPTGQRKERIDGIEVSLVDATMPAMILKASDVGVTGYESARELDANRPFFAKVEEMRMEAGRRMGLGDVGKSVVPKIMVLAPPRNGGVVTSRYLVPMKTHVAHAVTGAITLACCVGAEGTVADGIADKSKIVNDTMEIEHPSGAIGVALRLHDAGNKVEVESAGVIRTTRLLFAGEVMVPESASARGKAA
jgi:2-methylaconitate cis-trans-isomerase PrpF